MPGILLRAPDRAENNKGFFAQFGNALDIHYEEGPGVHNWSFWDMWIQKVLDWLPMDEKA